MRPPAKVERQLCNTLSDRYTVFRRQALERYVITDPIR